MPDNSARELRVCAFMDEPDAPHPDNPIHSTAGSRQHGFKAALVPGVDVYGWATRLIREHFGDEWLHSGWVEIRFRRPVYPGDELLIRLAPETTDGPCRLSVRGPDDGVRVEGRCGKGEAPWLRDIPISPRKPPVPSPTDRPRLTLENAPVGQSLLPMALDFSADRARAYAGSRQADASDLFAGERPLVHPAMLATQMIGLLHHMYHYGPAIHASSRIQHLGLIEAGDGLSISGHCRDAFSRSDRDWIVNCGSVWSAAGQELARLEHSAVFRIGP